MGNCLGFGPGGIIGGSCASVYQSVCYGGYTPAGGLFAFCQSQGARGCGVLSGSRSSLRVPSRPTSYTSVTILIQGESKYFIQFERYDDFLQNTTDVERESDGLDGELPVQPRDDGQDPD